MIRAIELAKLGEGLTRPNPPVGAVLVLEDYIVAEGWHKKAGEDHAERDCLKKLPPIATSLKNATLYITLEPCSTHGRTPPCTNIILEKGIGRVVVSVVDLNPAHAGRGLKLLEDAGVEVVSGVCESEGRELIAPFEKFITTGMPYVTLKLASTLDGKIADSRGDSKWITGPEARERVQEMRRRSDAIMVGAGTVRADNPSLLPRPSKARKPFRVIIGTDIPEDSKVWNDEAAERTLAFSVEGYAPPCPQATGRTMRTSSLQEILKQLAEKYSIMHVFCEGGGQLAAGLIEAGLVDEFAFFIAPKLMGADVTNLKFQTLEQVGNDILIKAKPEK
jgi:diaminohydroxyphosphoribosylaminopyrimidine deaminase/5-amino-6-(5-phosphoribosylamino)uracil reductase